MPPNRFLGLGLMISGTAIGVYDIANQLWVGAGMQGIVFLIGAFIWLRPRPRPLPPPTWNSGLLPAPAKDSPGAQNLRLRHPDFGWCLHCGMPWAVAEPHLVKVGDGGAFPCCTACWPSMTSIERRRAMERLVASWPPTHLSVKAKQRLLEAAA